jgi:hypothetical protein
LRGKLQAAFPGAEISLEYGPYSGKSVYVSIPQDEQDFTDDEISGEIDEIVSQYYDLGTFWAYIQAA